MQSGNILTFGAILAALLIFAIFLSATTNQFVALDDYAYIVENTNILNLNWSTVYWALTSFYEGNWHPLTMLSLAVDRQLWGLNPFGYHLSNLITHSCTVLCSTFLFFRLIHAAVSVKTELSGETGSTAVLSVRLVVLGSIAAALFFGLHPLRVESVVWASERKDVLCLFFMVTSIWLYLRYTEQSEAGALCSGWRSPQFTAALLMATLAQLSKPTAASLPLILCLIDWYPLQRIHDRPSLIRSLCEKTPFFIVSAIGTLLTLYAQQIAMNYAPDVAFVSRLLVACKALLFYIAKTAVPTGLAAFYMHPGDVVSFALAEYLFYALLIILISFAAFCAGRKNRLWPALWLFHIITLLPMLGLVQVGGQWAADRYSYLPSLGMSLLWGTWVAMLCDRARRSGISVTVSFGLLVAAAQLIMYTLLTVRQIPVWQNTETLATRIIEINQHRSGAPYQARAMYRNENGRYQEALADVGEAMKIALNRGLTRMYPEIAFEQALILKNLGRFAEALTIMEWGIERSVEPLPADVVSLRQELVRLVESEK